MRLVALILFFSSYQSFSQNLGHGYEFENNGKVEGNAAFQRVYSKTKTQFDTVKFDSLLEKALKQNEIYLNRKDSEDYELDGLTISSSDLQKSNRAFSQMAIDSSDLSNFDFYQINGEDSKGNVHFTGYFTPILQVRKKKDSIFQYPLYERPSIPNSQMPSRKEIDSDRALAKQNLELVYSSSLLDNYFMQVQGSGYVQYQDGSIELLSYGGNNGKKYVSIGKYLVGSKQISEADISLDAIRKYFEKYPDSLDHVLNKNPSYTFFTKAQSKVVGAANIELTPEISIAVDPKYIPLGSLLLAKVPILDEEGKLLKHEYRILIAQDTGGAIKGSGHVDIYFGVGNEAEKKASAMHHYGEIWLIKYKSNDY